MSDEEDEGRKGPVKCYGGTPRRPGSVIRVGFPCRTLATGRPPNIYDCMQCLKKGNPCPGKKVEPEPEPPEGITKRCGIKAQFGGEIIIKRELAPRPPLDCDTECPIHSPKKFEPEPPKVDQRPCPSPTHHHQTPMCLPPPFPNQPEISEQCRRVLHAKGPDSARYHPECPCICPPIDRLEDDFGGSTKDYESPERLLNPGEEERFETVRTREEIILDPGSDACNPCVCDDQCAKYVRVEDTFRRTRCYNPAPECYPPPVCYSQPDICCIRECQECPPRHPCTWEGGPCAEWYPNSCTWGWGAGWPQNCYCGSCDPNLCTCGPVPTTNEYSPMQPATPPRKPDPQFNTNIASFPCATTANYPCAT